MSTRTASQLPATPGRHDIAEQYNFEHFRREHLIRDMVKTYQARGIRPGEIAPDFELQRVGGATVRFSENRMKPVILHFGSFT